MAITCNQQKTAERRQALEAYLTANVLGAEFTCRHYEACRSSHAGTFYEGQLHHVGRFYDVVSGGVPFRVVVVGQEYGEGPARVSCEARYHVVMGTGLGQRFKAGDGYTARNPHMKGTTSVLRLLFGIRLGADHDSEFLTIGGERCHIFEVFALVNYLLCSAVHTDQGTRGQATPTMKKNCQEHFRKALEILEPVVIVVQGKSFWRWVRGAFDEVTQEAKDLPVYIVRLGSIQAFVAVFTHPSARFPHNWGANDHTPYLRQTMEPSVAWIRRQILGAA